MRHAALSLWLNAGGDPAQIAARAWNSVTVLLTDYTHCIHGHDDLLNQQIGGVLGPPDERGPRPSVKSQRFVPTARLGGKTSGSADRPRPGSCSGLPFQDSSRTCMTGVPAGRTGAGHDLLR
jgi:hypothetical protein